MVAARVVPMAYSNDGGGSIRLPASYCGIFGFKPSKRVNHFEDMSKAWGGAVVSHVSSVSVRNSAVYLDLVAENTEKAYSILNPSKDSYLFSTTQQPAKKLTIGIITEAPTKTKVYNECINTANLAAKNCETLGHNVDQAKWNFDGRELMRAFLTIVFSHTSRNIAEMVTLLGIDARKINIELKTRFMSIVGSGITQEEIEKSLEIWQQVSLKMSVLYQKYDVILTPTVATPPLASYALDPNFFEKLLMQFLISTRLGKKVMNKIFLETLIDKSLYQTPYTPIANMTGQPAMSVPLYWDQNGLPHGAHFMADNGNDKLLFTLAKQFETQHSWREKVPESGYISNTTL